MMGIIGTPWISCPYDSGGIDLSGSIDFVQSRSGSGDDKDEDGNDGYASDKQIHATLEGLKKLMVQL